MLRSRKTRREASLDTHVPDLVVSPEEGLDPGVQFIRIVDGVDVNRPVEAAEGRRVFELHPVG